MLTIRIDYLSGRCVATEYNDRGKAEWPPHPARLFSALVACWAEAEQLCPEERAALDWLAVQGPPAIQASEAIERQVLPHFVPVNDSSIIDTDKSLELVERSTQALQSAQVELQTAVSKGDAKAAKKAGKGVEKAEKELAAAQLKLHSRLADVGKASPAEIRRAKELLPEWRGKQARTFPSVSPVEPVVHMVWDCEPDPAQREVLDTLLRRVVRLGHSSSLVACRLVEEPLATNWTPDPAGDTILRVPGTEQVARLIEEWERHQETEPRVLPCRFVRYRRGKAAAVVQIERSTLSDRWIVFNRQSGPSLPSTRAVELARALRERLLAHTDDEQSRALLSGLDVDGRPLLRPHVAFLPLPFVGHRHADGSIVALALVLPRVCTAEERRGVLAAIDCWERSQRQADEEAPHLELGVTGATLTLQRQVWGPPRLLSANADTWCSPARSWLSATPVALDRNPGQLLSRTPEESQRAYQNAAEIIARSCEQQGLPAPIAIQVLPAAPLMGADKAKLFPPFPPDPQKTRRVKVHAELLFAEAVAGPICLGAGRYVGLGLFRPNDRGQASLPAQSKRGEVGDAERT